MTQETSQGIETFTKQLEYKQKILSSPYYKYQKLPPQSAAAVQITTTGGNDSVFELPPKVFNLARSFVTFILNPPAGTNVNFMHLGAITPFQQVQVISKTTGKLLMDLSQFQNFTKVIFQSAISQEEFLNQDLAYNNRGIVTFLRSCNSPNITITTAAPPVTNASFITPGSYGLRVIDSSPVFEYYNEQSYSEVGTAATADPIFYCKIPLGLIKESILEVDKDLFFNDVIQIRFVWGTLNKVGFNGVLATPSTVNTTAAFSGPINVINLNMYLAVEENQELAKQIKETVMTKGIAVQIPYPTAVRNTITNNSQHNITLLMNQTHGSRLMKIYHCMLENDGANNPTEQLNLAYNFNLSGNAIAAGSYFYCMLDSERIENYNINVTNYEDWLFIQDKIKNSITYCSGIYRYNWFWIEDFSTVNANSSENEDSDIRGLEMGNGHRFDFQYNAGGGVISAIHYDYIIGQKTLTLTANGPYLQ